MEVVPHHLICVNQSNLKSIKFVHQILHSDVLMDHAEQEDKIVLHFIIVQMNLLFFVMMEPVEKQLVNVILQNVSLEERDVQMARVH